MTRPLVVLIALSMLFTACSKEPAPPVKNPASPVGNPSTSADPEARVKEVIMRYNQLLAYGYQNLNMNPLQEVASVRQAEKAYHHMAALGEGGVRMLSHLKQIDFEKMDLSDRKAVVRTREVWDFSYSDIRTEKRKDDVKDFLYLMEYTLVDDNGRWLIQETAVIPGR
ncbi:hypothetical protein [Geobacter sp. DSM 9736]|uniref:hypothetical protein n=1 Tax=Geobacter sp. DSM 9736 TaxID=1277350 RepID=UPI000B51196F|nr:hypothetical protein [Geobacter sp. DSM 9736]SNB47388.1 hypothetical protein SAMN06269301_2875 [Geobacter sp. DSM 9736]